MGDGDGLDGLSAELAAGCRKRDVGEALAAGLGGDGVGSLEPRHQVIGRRDDEEVDDESQKEEADGGVEKVAVLDDAAVDAQGEGREVRFPDDGGDQWVDDVAHKRCNDGAECGANNDGDSKVEDIATKDKISKSLNHSVDLPEEN